MYENTRVFENVPLEKFTTFGIGGKVRRLVVTDSVQALKEQISSAGSLVIGGGSNLLVSDSGYDGNIVRFFSDEAGLELCPDGCFYVSGACRLPKAAKAAETEGLSGLEWAAGIPGTVGGALKMNAGAHGRDIGSVLAYADVLQGGKVRRLPAKDLGLTYRHSVFDGIVVGAGLKLEKSDPDEVAALTQSLLHMRRKSQPSGRSAGCIYKACRGIPAYRYIVGASLAGAREGDAVVSEKHANFIINTGKAKAADVLKLMERIETEVADKFGVSLQREVELIGKF